ncbi:hypothetical protein OE749_15735 [Aestuariibacter sp. AA17]|uniref:LemA family protein n=1 Tax=Fluctibacter corallii TaxID=2984329 RepID=A0ABT3ABU8_9ALTE|nr:hypothetical protein [Aestuariibacter sp. AA17]MCV2886144.1 hypothetical protein [Aestuariibacter sp. AA17]
MVTFSIIGFLVLALIYFVLRSQTYQRELNQLKHALRTVDSQSKYSLNALAMLSGQLQNNYLAKLEAKRKHALINQEEYDLLYVLLSRVEQIVLRCIENQDTVEEAVKRAISDSQYDMDAFKTFISKQPSDVRMGWTKNTVGGFISACHLLCSQRVSHPNDANTSTSEAS